MPTESRLLDLRRNTTTPALTLTRATATGTVGGWLVESQRRMKSNEHMLCVRITSPTGHQLDLAFTSSSHTTNARGPVASRLSPAVGQVFRAHRSARVEFECLAAIERVFGYGWEAAGNGWSGPGTLDLLQAAAYDISGDVVHVWRTNLSAWARRTNPNSWASEDPVPVGTIAGIIAAGLDEATVTTWFTYNDLRYPPAGTFDRVAKFRDAGWTREDVTALERVLTPPDEFGGPVPPAPVGWARMSPEQALLAARAGVPVTEALRLIRAGQFDEQALAMLASLRSPSGSDLLELVSA